MKNRNLIYIVTITLVSLLMYSCGTDTAHNDDDNHDDHTENGAAVEDEAVSDYVVRLTTQQMEVMGIQLGAFQDMNLSTTIKSNGTLELPPQNMASLSAVVDGRVKNVYVIEGEPVKKGQVLAILENVAVIDLQQEYYTLKSKLEYIEQDFNRKEDLYQDSIGSAKGYQKVKSEYEGVKAQFKAVRAKLQLLNFSDSMLEKGEISSTFKVISPIHGYVRLVEINIGMYVQPQEEMFEIVDNDHIHMDLMVYEKDIDKVKDDQKVVFSISTHPEHVFNGKVFSVGKAFESDLKAVRVHAEITSKPEGLLPGMYVNARIVIDSNTTQAIPVNAVIEEEGLSYIFIVNEPDSDSDHISFKKIEVNKGVEDMGFVAVVSAQPLPDNPRVVINAAYYILAEMNKGEAEGHDH